LTKPPAAPGRLRKRGPSDSSTKVGAVPDAGGAICTGERGGADGGDGDTAGGDGDTAGSDGDGDTAGGDGDGDTAGSDGTAGVPVTVALGSPTPAALIARIRTTYSVPLVSPVIVNGELAVPAGVQLSSPSREYSYPVIELPAPGGAVKVTTSDSDCGVIVTPVGAAGGGRTGVVAMTMSLCWPTPAAFTARTRT
jgi:hypothetical protein